MHSLSGKKRGKGRIGKKGGRGREDRDRRIYLFSIRCESIVKKRRERGDSGRKKGVEAIGFQAVGRRGGEKEKEVHFLLVRRGPKGGDQLNAPSSYSRRSMGHREGGKRRRKIFSTYSYYAVKFSEKKKRRRKARKKEKRKNSPSPLNPKKRGEGGSGFKGKRKRRMLGIFSIYKWTGRRRGPGGEKRRRRLLDIPKRVGEKKEREIISLPLY